MTRIPDSTVSRRTVLKHAAVGGALVGTSGIVAAGPGNRKGDATYEVTVENLTSPTPTAGPPATGQWFTPPLLATHRKPTGMFTRRGRELRAEGNRREREPRSDADGPH